MAEVRQHGLNQQESGRSGWRSASALATMTAALLAGVLVAPAYADSGGATSAPLDPAEAVLAPESQTRQADPNPAGCVGRTHDPHRSSHQPGTVNVVGETARCRWAVNHGIQVKLYRSRWWGWEQRGDSGMKRGFGRSIRTNAGSPRCVGDTHDWLGTSYHESVQGGKKYVASTSKRRNNITC